MLKYTGIIIIYMCDLLIIGDGYFEEYLPTIDKLLNGVNDKGLQVNYHKCKWFKYRTY